MHHQSAKNLLTTLAFLFLASSAYSQNIDTQNQQDFYSENTNHSAENTAPQATIKTRSSMQQCTHLPRPPGYYITYINTAGATSCGGVYGSKMATFTYIDNNSPQTFRVCAAGNDFSNGAWIIDSIDNRPSGCPAGGQYNIRAAQGVINASSQWGPSEVQHCSIVPPPTDWFVTSSRKDGACGMHLSLRIAKPTTSGTYEVCSIGPIPSGYFLHGVQQPRSGVCSGHNLIRVIKADENSHSVMACATPWPSGGGWFIASHHATGVCSGFGGEWNWERVGDKTYIEACDNSPIPDDWYIQGYMRHHKCANLRTKIMVKKP